MNDTNEYWFMRGYGADPCDDSEPTESRGAPTPPVMGCDRDGWDPIEWKDDDDYDTAPDVRRGTLRRAGPPGVIVSARGHAGAVLRGKAVYVFGGVCPRTGQCLATMTAVSMRGRAETAPPQHASWAGPHPCPRRCHSFTALPPHRTTGILFGGTAGLEGLASLVADVSLGDVWGFDPETGFWVWETVSVIRPQARHMHAAAAFADSRLVVCGGRGLGGVYGDVWTFDLLAHTWQEVPRHGPAPCPRYGHAAASGPHDSTMLMCGGQTESCAPLDDVWEFAPRTGLWREVLVRITPRAFHGFVALSSTTYVVLGGRVRDYVAPSVVVDVGGMAFSRRVEFPLEAVDVAFSHTCVVHGPRDDTCLVVSAMGAVVVDVALSLRHLVAMAILSKGIRYMSTTDRFHWERKVMARKRDR